jgi:hypothetical protein
MHLFKRSDGSPRRKRFVALFMATFAVLAGCGAAFAYWTIGGSGNGTASTGSASAVTVLQTTTIAGLYPGDVVPLAGDFNNPGTGSVYITSVTATIGAFSSQTNATLPACTQADFAISGTSNTPGEIAVGTGGSWSGLSVTLIDSATNQDNCESLSGLVPIVYTSH